MWFDLPIKALILLMTYPWWSGILVCAWMPPKTRRSPLPVSTGLTPLLLAPALEVSTPTPRLTLQLGETQGGRIEGLHALPLGSDVPLQQSMLLQQVLGLHQVLPTLPGQQLSLQEGAALSSFLALALRSLPAPHCASQPSAPLHSRLNSDLYLGLRVPVTIISLSAYSISHRLHISRLRVCHGVPSTSVFFHLSPPLPLSPHLYSSASLSSLYLPPSLSLHVSPCLYFSLCFHPFLHLSLCLSVYLSPAGRCFSSAFNLPMCLSRSHLDFHC